VEKKQIHETRFREMRVRMIQGLVGSRLIDRKEEEEEEGKVSTHSISKSISCSLSILLLSFHLGI